MRTAFNALAIASVISLTACSVHEGLDPEKQLWYDSPALKWEEALPVGNGRMGMMPYGMADTERVLLN